MKLVLGDPFLHGDLVLQEDVTAGGLPHGHRLHSPLHPW